MMQGLVRKELVVNGIRLTYYEREGLALTLLFLHGWRSRALIWKDVVKYVPEPVKCVALDLPGFGDSDCPDSSADLSSYVGVVEQFVLKLGLTNVVVVGHSFGGRIAIKLASRTHSWLSGVVLVNAAGKANRSVAISAKKLIAKILKPFFSFGFMQSARRKIYELIGARDYIAEPLLKDVFVRVISEDLEKYAAEMLVPVQVIWGRDDREVPVEFAKDFAKKQSDAYLLRYKVRWDNFIEVPGAGHFFFLDKPEVLVFYIKDFIQKL